MKLKFPQRWAKGARKNSYWLEWLMFFVVSVYCKYAETDSVRPTTEGHPSAAGKGGVSFGSQLGFESPAFH